MLVCCVGGTLKTAPRPRAPAARDSSAGVSSFRSTHASSASNKFPRRSRPRASSSPGVSSRTSVRLPGRPIWGSGPRWPTPSEAGEPAAGGRSLSRGWEGGATRGKSGPTPQLALPWRHTSSTRSAHRSTQESFLGSGGRAGTRDPTLSTRPALRSLDRTQPSVLQILLAPFSPCPLTPPHPSSGPLRTLQIPGRTFRRKQVDQPRPPSSSLHSLALADWGPWSLRSSPAASRLGNNCTLTTSWMGIPAFWWESQAGCLNAGRDTPTSPRGNPLKIYLPSVYRRKLRTREPTECASRWVGRGELGKFQPSILKRKTSSVSKFLGAGGRLPWKRAGTRVREGKSWRGVRKASR